MASRKKKAPATTGGDAFANDAERSKADILAVATEEFATSGLSGARVDVRAWYFIGHASTPVMC